SFRSATRGIQTNNLNPNIAADVGAGFIVQMTEGSYRVFSDLVNPIPSAQDKTLFQFWDDTALTLVATTVVTSPRLVFDQSTNRWFAAAIEQTVIPDDSDKILVAVSNTSNPTGTWNAFRLDADGSDATEDRNVLAPINFGLDADGVYVTANTVRLPAGTGRTNDVTIMAIPKTRLTGGAAGPSTAGVTPNFFIDPAALSSTAITAFNAPQPIGDFGPSDSLTQLFWTDATSGSIIRRVELTNPQSLNPNFTILRNGLTTVLPTAYSTALNIPQPG
ncbi:MAG: hypothetical protein HYV60_13630, partial [Planctomycetia bacterium]|nr:hypothetical protein [Planctomycetia bacterium]